jgi:hypothetical protein
MRETISAMSTFWPGVTIETLEILIRINFVRWPKDKNKFRSLAKRHTVF